MWRLLVMLLLVIIFERQARAQVDSVAISQDSVKTPEDSVKYKSLEELSKKSKFTQFLHSLIFKSMATPAKKPQKKKIRKLSKKNLPEGKIIREINVTTLDPFGYDVQDTTKHPHGFLMDAGNTLHVKSQRIVIKNLLLFNVNQRFDSLRVRESERLIRSQNYIQNVRITTVPVSPKSDSVDVFIRVTDSWTLVPAVQFSKSSAELSFTDNNLVGLGSTFHGESHLDRTTGKGISRFSYFIPNIKNTFINFNIQFMITDVSNLIRTEQFSQPYFTTVSSNLPYRFSGNQGIVGSVEIARPFYSPLAKWAGGIFAGQMITSQGYVLSDTLHYTAGRTNIQDIWAARSWQLFRGRLISERTTNFILSGRLLRIRFPGNAPEADSIHIFNGENLYFIGFGLSSRQYIKDRYIFNYGKTEDVPEGHVIGITLGFDSERKDRLYAGFKAAMGRYFDFGYLGTNFEYGTYISKTGFSQEVLMFGINYFTSLYSLGKWKIRQFARPVMILGLNRKPGDNVSFGDLMKGFGDAGLPAQHVMTIALQTQSYAPWNLAGFHLGPYFFASFGMLGTNEEGFSNSRLYSLMGLGLLIRNDYLNFGVFQLSLTFYPFIPDRGNNIFKANVYKTTHYGFTDFDISKPRVVDYR